MALNAEEINKINTMFKQIDEKDISINNLNTQLETAQATVNFLSNALEEYKTTVSELNNKVDLILEAVTKKAPAPVKKTAAKK